MRPRIRAFALLMLAGAAPLTAQAPSPAPTPAHPRAEELRHRVRERFTERVQQELDLTPNQMTRLRATAGTFATERRDLEGRQRVLRDAPATQLRPGVAASQDSVARLTDSLLALRLRYVESLRAEQGEMAGYLDPVQRARLLVMRERLLDRAREFRHRHRMDR
jgi:Spy/CpxP family protein refolding chaperone